jgi:hypothetical protein
MNKKYRPSAKDNIYFIVLSNNFNVPRQGFIDLTTYTKCKDILFEMLNKEEISESDTELLNSCHSYKRLMSYSLKNKKINKIVSICSAIAVLNNAYSRKIVYQNNLQLDIDDNNNDIGDNFINDNDIIE